MSKRGRLIEVLRRWSTPKSRKDARRLYKEWKLLEVRDVGARQKKTACLCGRPNIRFACIIRNDATRVQVYVGSDCVNRFHRSFPVLLNQLEDLPQHSIKGKYKGRSGKRCRFEIGNHCKLTKLAPFLFDHFQVMPLYRKPNGVWEIKVNMPRTRIMPRLRKNHWYHLNVTPETHHGRLPGCWLKFGVNTCVQFRNRLSDTAIPRNMSGKSTQTKKNTVRAVRPNNTARTSRPENTVRKVRPKYTAQTVRPKYTAQTVRPKNTVETACQKDTTGTVRQKGIAEVVPQKGIAEVFRQKDTSGTVRPKNTVGTLHQKDTAGTVCPKNTVGTLHQKDTAGTVCQKNTELAFRPKSPIRTVRQKNTIRTVRPKITAKRVRPKNTEKTVRPKNTVRTVRPKTTVRTVHQNKTSWRVP